MAHLTNFPELTTGSIKRILNEEILDYAILQIMGYKKVPGQGASRYRLLLNDGETLYPFAILATQLNHLIEEKHLEKFTILKLNKYVCTEVQTGKKIIICLEIESLLPGSIVKDQITLHQSNTVNKSSLITPSTSHSNHVENSPINFNGKVASKSHNILPMSSSNYNRGIDLGQPSTSHSNHGENGPININGKVASNSHNILPMPSFNYDSMVDLGQPSISSIKANSSPSKCISTQTTLTLNHHSENSLVVSSGNPNFNGNKSPCNRVVNQRYNTQTINQAGVVIPIISLTPYQNKWTVKARLVYKTAIVTYSNQRGAGKFFSFYLLDETAEIKAIAFNNQAVLYDYLQVNKVYYISGANVKPSKENSLVKSDFEIMVTDYTKIESAEDAESIPFLKFNFTPITQIKTLSKDNYVDVIGICCSVSNLRTIVSKVNDREVDKVDLLLIDMGEVPITLSLWGSDAKEFKRQDKPVIVVRNARVTDFNGISLSVSQASMFFVNPSIPEVSQLRTWFDNLGGSLNIKTFSDSELNSQSWKTFWDITSADIEESNRAEYFMTKSSVVMVNKDKCMYRSCPAEGCFKKVHDLENGLFKCDKCEQEYDVYKWTLLLSLNLADFTDSHWTVAFRDVAESMIGYSAEQLSQMKEENEDKYLDVLSALHFQTFVFKLRSKVEVFNETSRLKTTVLEANPVEPTSYAKKLITDIRRMERILSCE